MNLESRLLHLEQSSISRIAEAERTGDFSKLTVSELEQYVWGSGDELGRRLQELSDEELQKIASGDELAIANFENSTPGERTGG